MKASLFFILSLIVATSLFDTISQLFLKSSINSLNLHINSIKKVAYFILRLIRIPKLWLGFIFSTLSLLVWLFVLSKADLSFAFSVDSMHYIFIALGSMWLLKERVGAVRWLGIASIVFGIALVSLS